MSWLRVAQQASDHHRRIITAYGRELRCYPVPLNDRLVYLPGVTSILSATAPPSDQRRLDRWKEREIAAGRDPMAAAYRGSLVHLCLEHRVRGLPLPTEGLIDGEIRPVTDEVLQHYDGMWDFIRDFDEFVWNEEPLRLGWDHCWSSAKLDDPGRLARVWSSKLGVAGTPDLITQSKQHGYVLSDFKTAQRPYFQPGPDLRVPSDERWNNLKYTKTVRQLSLYAQAIRETLGIKIDKLHIVVGTPNSAHEYWVRPDEWQREGQAAFALCNQFWHQVAMFQHQIQPEIAASALSFAAA